MQYPSGRVRWTGVLALCIYAAVRAEEPLTVAVMDFQGKNVSAADASTVADFLRTELVNTGAFTVVDRGNMDKLLAEAGFQMSGCTEAGCAVEVGRILNVSRMVMGSLSRIETVYYVSASVVDVETGKILKAYREEAETARGLAPACERLARAMAGTPAAPPRPAVSSDASADEARRRELQRLLTEEKTAASARSRYTPEPPSVTAASSPEKPAPAPAAATVQRKKHDTKGFLEFMVGLPINDASVNLQFKNATYPINENELGLDLNGNGIVEGNGYRFVRLEGLEGEMPGSMFGLRLSGFFSRVFGVEMLVSYYRVSTLAQTNVPLLNSYSTRGGIVHLPDEYLTLTQFGFAAGVHVRPFVGPVQPYVGLNLGLSFFGVHSDYISGYNQGLLGRPLNDLGIGLTITPVLAGVRVHLGKLSVFSEYRLIVPGCFFDRLIKEEDDFVEGGVSVVTFGVGVYLFE